MSNIDLAQMQTPETRAAAQRAQYEQAVKSECRRRLLAVFDEFAQINMAAAASAGALAPGEQALHKAGRDWVAAMLAQCTGLISAASESGSEGHMADAAWPAPPDGLEELARRF